MIVRTESLELFIHFGNTEKVFLIDLKVMKNNFSTVMGNNSEAIFSNSRLFQCPYAQQK